MKMGSSTKISEDEGETTKPVAKGSKSSRLKEAISKTKTQFKKKTDRSDIDKDVEDFLAAGRNSSSTGGRPSTSDSLTSGRPSISESHHLHRNHHQPQQQEQQHHPSSRSGFPAGFVQPQHSPRRAVVAPRLDVAHSKRWPDARPIPSSQDKAQEGFLRAYHHQGSRSRSVSSLSKGRGRTKGLNVHFTSQPPVIIGEGGDDAETPPIEISQIAARARSLSPTLVIRRKPIPGQPRDLRSYTSRRHVSNEDAPYGAHGREGPGITYLRRAQTATTTSSAFSSDTKTPLQKEFEMSLGLDLGSRSINSGSGNAQSNTRESTVRSPQPPLLAPKPIHPPVPYPIAKIIPEAHDLRSVHGTVNLRSNFDKNQPPPHLLLHDGGNGDSATASASASASASAPSLPQQQPPTGFYTQQL